MHAMHGSAAARSRSRHHAGHGPVPGLHLDGGALLSTPRSPGGVEVAGVAAMTYVAYWPAGYSATSPRHDHLSRTAFPPGRAVGTEDLSSVDRARPHLVARRHQPQHRSPGADRADYACVTSACTASSPCACSCTRPRGIEPGAPGAVRAAGVSWADPSLNPRCPRPACWPWCSRCLESRRGSALLPLSIGATPLGTAGHGRSR